MKCDFTVCLPTLRWIRKLDQKNFLCLISDLSGMRLAVYFAGKAAAQIPNVLEKRQI